MRFERFETIDRLFGLLSVAMLGLFAIACVPNVKAEPFKPAAAVSSPAIELDPSINLELDTVEQVNAINSGSYSTFTTGN